MMRLVWLTDIHLNFLRDDEIARFCERIRKKNPEAVLIGGDNGEAQTVCGYLRTLERLLPVPIYFVLGNHDYYFGSIGNVREEVKALAARSERLFRLPDAGIVELTADTALIGHDGWADGRFGDFFGSHMVLNDYLLIEELMELSRTALFARLNALGDEAAAYFQSVLPEALERYRRLLVLTHVPPFREACWHQGRISDDDALPHFSSKAVGEVLRETMLRFPDREMTVLCGHTHSGGEARIIPNLLVRTGKAEYGSPRITDFIDI